MKQRYSGWLLLVGIIVAVILFRLSFFLFGG